MSVPAERLPDTALEVHELSVSYGGVKAVDGVSFDVPQGSIIGLIGPNGAGKTTVFDAICGFAPIERGRISLGGRDITNMSSAAKARAGLGRSFQDARLFQSLTVAEALSCAFERHIRGRDPVSTMLGLPWVRSSEKRVAQRVEEIIELMGLTAFRDKFISELSTGSRRVVDLACTLAHEPTVLLLDEPSSGMAQKETEAMGPLLIRVKESTGCTMLLIEHDMPLITSVSDELIALETGRIIAQGTPKEVTNDARVVEAYLGTDESIIQRSGEARPRPKARPKKKAKGGSKRSTSSKKDGKATKKRVRTTQRSGERSASEASDGRRSPSKGSTRRRKSSSGTSEAKSSQRRSSGTSRRKKTSSSSSSSSPSSGRTSSKKRSPSSTKKTTKKTTKKRRSPSSETETPSSSGKRAASSKRSSSTKSTRKKQQRSSSSSKGRKASSEGSSKTSKAKPKPKRRKKPPSDDE